MKTLRKARQWQHWLMIPAVTLTVTACGGGGGGGSSGPTDAEKAAVIDNYADVAFATFSDALSDAQALRTAINAFVAAPSAVTLTAAKTAYATSRETYQQTEALRFDEAFVSNSPDSDGGLASIDAWEGQVNAWPLDEALIDYVDGSYSGGAPDAGANVINNTSITVNGETVDTSTIDKALLVSLNEIGGSEANVATGYHAIEFLLWGQDLSQAQSTPGQRPFTDYAPGSACTNGRCGRRGLYLKAAADLLVDDLTAMVAEWNPASTGKTLRTDLLALNVDIALQRMFYGMGSLALGELASERMRVARLADSPEDEHDCFSDTSSNSYFYDGKSVANLYRGQYTPRSGAAISGPSLSSLVSAVSTEDGDATEAALTAALAKLQLLKDAQAAGKTFDYLIDSNDPTELVRNAENGLVDFTEQLEIGADALGISVDSDPGTTNPDP